VEIPKLNPCLIHFAAASTRLIGLWIACDLAEARQRIKFPIHTALPQAHVFGDQLSF
jgi:hypothetical protein